MSTPTLAPLVDTYKALGHATRLRILAMLRGGELCVCQITAVLGLAASTVSAHLAELRRAGLVEEQKEGRWVRYRLHEATGDLAALWRKLDADPQARADAALLAHLRRVPLETLCRADLDLSRLGIRVPRRAPNRHEGA
jgi:DNA-binding transcriptional ArsR family regulator